MLFVLTLGLLMSSHLSLAQLGIDEFTIAEDGASNYSGWNNADNKGSGFESWNLSFSNSSGNYIGDTGQGNISFGIFADPGGSITAARPLSNSLREGDKINVDIGATNVDTSAEILVQLVDGTTIVFTLKFVGGSSDWVLNDGGSDFSSGESFATNDSKNFTFTYEGGNNYSYTLGTNGSGNNLNATNTINNIDEIRFINNGQGSGENFGFNNLEITSKYTIPSNIATGKSSDVTSDTTVPFLDIQSGGSVEVEDGNTWTLTIQNGGTFTNNGSFSAKDGSVSFPGAGTISGTTTFNDVDIAGGVDFGANSTIKGNLIIETNGAVVTNPPEYSDTATLIYSDDNQIYGRNTEWSSTTGSGYPNNVVIQDNTTLDLGANGGNDTARKIAGDLLINSGSTLSLDLQAMSQALSVMGDFTNNGTINLSSTTGGDLKVNGNFKDNGTFNYNGRALFLEGSTDQSITTSADPYTIDVLRIKKSAGEVIMNQDIIIDETGDPLEMSDQSILNLNGYNLTIGQDGVTSQVSFTDNAALKVSDQSDLILRGNGSMGDLKFDSSTNRVTNKIRYVDVDRGPGSDVSLGNQLYLKDSIKLEGGTLNSGEKLTFVSNNSKTAQVGEVPASGGTIAGDVIVERFVPKSNRAFRYISSPVNTSGTINANLQEGATTASVNPDPKPGFGTHITGGIPADGFDATQTGNPSMFEWDESLATPDWVEIPNTDTKTMNVDEAYALMIRGDRSTTLNSNTAVGDPTSLRFTGTLVDGNQDVATTNLSSTSGNYNLVANPYQAIVDAKDLLEKGSSDLNNIIYIYDPTLGSRGGYATIDLSDPSPSGTPYDNNLSDTNANQFILPNQAFFVETIDSDNDGDFEPSLTFKEEYKNTEANFVDTFSATNILSEMHINLRRQPANVLVDGVTARFDPNHTNAVNNADADEVWNFDEWVALFNSNLYLSIEKRATPVANDSIQIYTGNYQSDSYVWQIDISNIDRKAVLVDTYLDTETSLNADNKTNIAFDVDSNIPASTDPFRFSIRFTDETLSVTDAEETNFSVYPNPVTNSQFTITGLANGGNARIQLFDMSGKLLVNKTRSAENTMTIDIDQSLPTGVYQLQVTQNQMQYQSILIISK